MYAERKFRRMSTKKKTSMQKSMTCAIHHSRGQGGAVGGATAPDLGERARQATATGGHGGGRGHQGGGSPEVGDSTARSARPGLADRQWQDAGRPPQGERGGSARGSRGDLAVISRDLAGSRGISGRFC